MVAAGDAAGHLQIDETVAHAVAPDGLAKDDLQRRATHGRIQAQFRQAAVQALCLLAAAIGIDALGVRRGLKSEYFVFTDPLIILAGAVLLDRMRSLRFHQWAWPIALTLVVVHLVVGQAEPVKYALKRAGPQAVCEWNVYHLPLLPLPWCRNSS